MINKKKNIRIFILLLLVLSFMSANLFAANIAQPVEYTEEYKEWLELSDEEKEGLIMPRMYDIPKTTVQTKNPLKMARNLGSQLLSSYSLRSYIPENVVIKNQENTNLCWAFASIAALETNLALKNYYNGVTAKVYDFSERHMEYATSRVFANNQINEKGFNRTVGSGGNRNIYIPYFTNGLGAINEEEMPFEDNEDTIYISEIQGKTVASQVYDTVTFPSYQITDDTTEIKKQMKEHIKNYGGIEAGIYGAQLMSDYYNNDTGAIYCDDSDTCKMNHSVLIIGWDDNYDKTNFNESHRPTNNGAWIIKNSWGTRLEYSLSEMKAIIFIKFESECIENGWNSASEIPDDVAKEMFTQSGYTIENDKAILEIGDKGFMYVSYEDVNIYYDLTGIIKASDTVDYKNIYQYNEFGQNVALGTKGSAKLYLANVFEKQTTEKEYLTQVSIYAPETYTCKVYVNPNGSSKAQEDLQEVELEAGETEIFDAGYHTLEFSKPVEIKSDNFVVVVEIQGTREDSVYYALESNQTEMEMFNVVKVENGKCFASFSLEDNDWTDLSTLDSYKGDSTIKAFSVLEDTSLKDIQITTPPTKVNYIEGQNFDKTGMIITANYNNGDSKEITDYSIENGANLKVGQTSVTIKYEDMTVNQEITVEANSVISISIKEAPTKTTYKAGNDFDNTGMVVEAEYKDGSTKVITDYKIEDGTDLKNGQQTVTISYEGQTVTQPITVEPNLLERIEIKKAPDKTKYVVGQDFDKTGMVVYAIYQDGTEKEITSYTIEDGDSLTLDKTEVTIRFEDKTVTQAITVEEKTLVSISITKMPTKIVYIQNKEELDLTGGKIQLTYSDSTKEELDMTSEQVIASGFNNKIIGKNTITLTYQNKTAEFDVEIQEEEIEGNPEGSDFDNIKGDIKKLTLYAYDDKDKEEYITIEVEISNIQIAQGNDKMEYYYSLSTNQDEESIDNWIKIEETQNSEDKLKFVIDTREIENYQEIFEGENVYLYIKEVATKNDEQKVTISKSIVLGAENAEVEIYIDDIKIEPIIENPDKNNNGNIVDNTVATTIIPQTGQSIIIIFAIFVIATFGVVMYVRYKKIDR